MNFFFLVSTVQFLEVYDKKEKFKMFLLINIGGEKVIGYTFGVWYTNRGNCTWKVGPWTNACELWENSLFPVHHEDDLCVPSCPATHF